MAVVKKKVTKKELTKQISKKKKVTPKKKTVKKTVTPIQKQKPEKSFVLKKETIVIREKLQELGEPVYETKSGFRISKLLYGSGILLGAIILGVILYRPIKTDASNYDVECTYGDWEESEVSYCLVSPEGVYFKNDKVEFIYNEKTGGCTKKERRRTCTYKEA